MGITHYKDLAERKLRHFFGRSKVRPHILHAQNTSWIRSNIPCFKAPPSEMKPFFAKIESLANATQEKGAMPLWSGYSNVEGYPTSTGPGAERTLAEVSSKKDICEFYSWLVVQRRPDLIVEIGGAFGVSDMYWTAGLMFNKHGALYSFEPNEIWASYAEENIKAIGDRGHLVIGSFEENLDKIPNRIDLAFIDAIHTGEFVRAQLRLILERASPGALIVFDDIRFSNDMLEFWQEIAYNPYFVAAFELKGSVGIVELSS